MPILLENGKVHIEVSVRLRQRVFNGTIVGATSPDVGCNVRATRIAAEIENAQTLAIGGLIEDRVSTSTRKVAILGDLPLIGELFRTVSYNETEEEMLILLTPHLVEPEAQVPPMQPGSEE